jgi:hypothetical protein
MRRTRGQSMQSTSRVCITSTTALVAPFALALVHGVHEATSAGIERD